MSEFTNTREYRANIRWRLMATVSGVALLTSAYATSEARAADSPPLWIELDGQFARQETGQDVFLPSFMLASPFNGASQSGLEKGAPTIWDKGAKVSFQPAGTNWVISAGIRYGKNGRHEVRDQLTAHPTAVYNGNYNAYQNFASLNSESHTILDFQAGKDVGMGKFGSDGSSIVSLGVRYAQFNARNNVGIQSQPANVNIPFHRYYGTFSAKRKFSGIGPSLSWDASADLAGNRDAGGITFDWGANGAVLFGRQDARGHHRTTDYYLTRNGFVTGDAGIKHLVYQHSGPLARNRQAIVPNLGGFAGVSWRYADAKISLGYRADMFFGAVDGGVATRKTENRGFFGPFASISVGIGD